MGSDAETGLPDVDELTAEVGRLRAERAALERALDEREQGAQRVRRHRARRLTIGFLVLLSSILVAVTTVTVWSHWLLLDSDHFTNTVAPLPSDPTVANALSLRITSDAFEALDVEQRLADRLPPRLTFIAGPLTEGVQGFVHDRVNQLLRSAGFSNLWREAVHFAHAQAVAVMRGEGNVVSTTDGTVTLNLIPMVDGALQTAQDQISRLLGRDITIPTITSGQLPDAARERLEEALDLHLPDSFGQVVVFRSSAIEQGQRAVKFFDRLVIVLPILALLVVTIALWLSVNRRRTLLQILAGSLLALILVRVVVRWIEADVSGLGRTPQGQRALHIVAAQIFQGIFETTMWLSVAAFVVVAVALLTGPYGWAITTRRQTVSLAKSTVVAGSRLRTDETVMWIRVHHDALQFGGVIGAVVLLLLLDISWVSFLVVGALLAVYEFVLARITGSPEGEEPMEGLSPPAGEVDPAQQSPDPALPPPARAP
jgi:hypothetical protein